MCDPLTIAIVGGVVSTVGAGVQAVQASKAAKAQAEALQHQQEVAAEENRVQASTELFDQMRAARREQASIRTAAGEAGLSLTSGSIEGLLNDSAMQMEMRGSRTLANMESRQAANDAEAQSAYSKIEKSSLLSAGLQIAGTATSAWSNVSKAKIAKAAASKA